MGSGLFGARHTNSRSNYLRFTSVKVRGGESWFCYCGSNSLEMPDLGKDGLRGAREWCVESRPAFKDCSIFLLSGSSVFCRLNSERYWRCGVSTRPFGSQKKNKRLGSKTLKSVFSPYLSLSSMLKFCQQFLGRLPQITLSAARFGGCIFRNR